MKIKIYGKPQCTYCDQAKALATAKGHEVEYIDIAQAGIDGAKLGELCGTPVRTVPQIFVDEKYVGGFTELQAVIE